MRKSNQKRSGNAALKPQAMREVQAVNKALKAGYSPRGVTGSRNKKSAVAMASTALGANRIAFRERVGFPDQPGRWKIMFGLEPDWSLYVPPPEPTDQPEIPAVEHSDPILVRRLRDENQRLNVAVRQAERRAAAAENYREQILGLQALPPTPERFAGDDGDLEHGETIVLVLSDLHWGENVDLEAMDGLNSYNVEIARDRLSRWADTVIELATKHWSPNLLPPQRIVLILGGDLISGGIHYELAKTDHLAPLPAVRDVADHLGNNIAKIKRSVACELDIISIPGNHSRTTMKPESKEVAATSYDILVSDFLELQLSRIEGINFWAPPSPDALFSIYGWRVLATHGDRIGSRGGQGFVGPAATAARGLKRVSADYATRGIHVDLILICHLHTPLQLEEGYVNGSLVGTSEYARDGRFRPAPAKQLFLTVHPRHLVSQQRWIEPGRPEEGSLYVPPPVDRVLRPRYRVQAPTIKTE